MSLTRKNMFLLFCLEVVGEYYGCSFKSFTIKLLEILSSNLCGKYFFSFSGKLNALAYSNRKSKLSLNEIQFRKSEFSANIFPTLHI